MIRNSPPVGFECALFGLARELDHRSGAGEAPVSMDSTEKWPRRSGWILTQTTLCRVWG